MARNYYNDVLSVCFKNSDETVLSNLQNYLQNTLKIYCEMGVSTRDMVFADVQTEQFLKTIEKGLQNNRLNFLEYNTAKVKNIWEEYYKIRIKNVECLNIEEFIKLLQKEIGADIAFQKSNTHLTLMNFRSLAEMKSGIEIFLTMPRDTLEFNFFLRDTYDGDCLLSQWRYHNQLELKNMFYRMIMYSLTTGIRKSNVIFRNFKITPSHPIRPADDVKDYRNVVEIIYYRDVDYELVPRLRIHNQADVNHIQINDMPHIPEATKRAIQAFTIFLDESEFDIYDPKTGKGHYNNLKIRVSKRTYDLMLVIGVHSANVNLCQRELIKAEINAFYKDILLINFNLTSLYYMEIRLDDFPNEVSFIENLFGEKCIVEIIDDLSFNIGPLECYPINITAQEQILKHMIKMIKPKKSSTVLIELGCGTGVVSLALSKVFHRVFAFDSSNNSIIEAIANQDKNKIENVHFFVRDPLDGTIKTLDFVRSQLSDGFLEIIILIHSPRAEMDEKSIAGLRNVLKIQRILFIACTPQSAINNWVELTLPESESHQGPPFLPVRSLAFDWLPQTAHLCIAILFKRIYNSSISYVKV